MVIFSGSTLKYFVYKKHIDHYLLFLIGPDSGYRSWSVAQWRDWTNCREPFHRSVKRNRKHKLTEKPTNTVIIATPDEVAQAFYGPLSMVNHKYYIQHKIQK